jgi:sulfite dehydrogenase
MPETRWKLSARSFAAALAAALAASASAKEIALPADTTIFRASELPGYALASGYCVLCHSADYVALQPPAEPKAFWLTEVTKMQKKYGAPFADPQLDVIADYLTATYGPAATASPAAPTDRRP